MRQTSFILGTILGSLIGLTRPAMANSQYGILGGVNISSARYQWSQANGEQSLDSRTAPYIEWSMQLPLGSIFSFNPGLSFVGKGSVSNGVTDSYSFLEVPMRVRAEFNLDDSIKPFLVAGIGYGILLNSSRSDGASANYLYSNEGSVQFGGGIEFALSSHSSLQLAATMSRGLTNLLSNVSDPTSTIKESEVYLKSSGLYLGIGLKFFDGLDLGNSFERAETYVHSRREQRGNPQLLLESPVPSPTEKPAP